MFNFTFHHQQAKHRDEDNLKFNFDFLPDPPSASLLGTALCYIDAKPMECIKEQAGRMLNQWDQTLDEKKHELMGEFNGWKSVKCFTFLQHLASTHNVFDDIDYGAAE